MASYLRTFGRRTFTVEFVYHPLIFYKYIHLTFACLEVLTIYLFHCHGEGQCRLSTLDNSSRSRKIFHMDNYLIKHILKNKFGVYGHFRQETIKGICFQLINSCSI